MLIQDGGPILRPGPVAFVLALAIGALAAPPLAAQATLEVTEIGLTTTFPMLPSLEQAAEPGERRIRALRGRMGEKRVWVNVYLMSEADYGYDEPEHYLESKEAYSEGRMRFTERCEIEGTFGTRRYAEFASGELLSDGDPPLKSTISVLSFMTEAGACSLDVIVRPEASKEELAAIRAVFVEETTVAGTPRDPQWTAAEAEARWKRDVPASLRDELKPPHRTAHYIVLTNSSSGPLFGKKMEESYAKIRACFPFPERKHRRLLPVFLFKSVEQYDAFCDAMGTDDARVTAGHAWRDYYATSYESPNDPIHIHEATHQIFKNRLYLNGGGSWFQEGVAEYMETSRSERNVIAQLVKQQRVTPLRDLIRLPKLIHARTSSNTGVSAAHEHYTQAALLIEFLRESKEMKAKFPAFLATVGRANDDAASDIEAAIRASLGMSVDELDRAFQKYCTKR